MTLEIPVDVWTVTITKEQLMKAYAPLEVNGYCKGCSSYGRNYSCPDFDFTTESYMNDYTHVTLIMTYIEGKFIEKNWDFLGILSYDSIVKARYNNGKRSNVISDFSMYLFNDVKDQMDEILLEAESDFTNTLSLPPGNCTRCLVCMKEEGLPCEYPEKCRYSLEALGFLVSDIYRDWFDEALTWSEGSLPEAFHTCSGILSLEPLDEEVVKSYVMDHLSVFLP